ncbi:hypothetical protein FOA52_004299 [Chlamydomonas sp. UWO 241]|nr:hypothetical protein FOA52_004299 [Chlamydomonas sp. UWO 241]
MAEAGGIDTSRVETKIWLVKVPVAVAQLWRPLCEQSMRATAIDEDEAEVELGTVCLQPGASISSGGEGTLAVKGAEAAGLPARYRLTPIDGGPPKVAITFRAPTGPTDCELSGLRVEGSVSTHYNVVPFQSVDTETGALQIDEAYRNMSRDRNIEASAKTRTVAEYKDTRENVVAQRAAANKLWQQRKREAPTKLVVQEKKRLSKPTAVLENDLFRLFERQRTWTLKGLQDEANVPMQNLKEVLVTIAFLNMRGPDRGLYELKHEYRDGGKEAEGDG